MRSLHSRCGLRRYFEHNDGRLIHKWMHYFEIYERHFERFAGRRVTFLEIGVFHGGSLQMWRSYFGRRAHIVGVDIDPRVAELAEDRITIEIGDQSDPWFNSDLAERHGPFDMILDDGSHFPAHQIASIETLWPALVEGGVYMVEDVHTSFMKSYGDGDTTDHTFMDWVADRMDDLHAHHFENPDAGVNEWTRTLDSIHVYDSIVVLEKRTRERPVHRKTGRPSFHDIGGHGHVTPLDADHERQLATLGLPGARLRRFRRDPLGTLRRIAGRFR